MNSSFSGIMRSHLKYLIIFKREIWSREALLKSDCEQKSILARPIVYRYHADYSNERNTIKCWKTAHLVSTLVDNKSNRIKARCLRMTYSQYDQGGDNYLIETAGTYYTNIIYEPGQLYKPDKVSNMIDRRDDPIRYLFWLCQVHFNYIYKW